MTVYVWLPMVEYMLAYVSVQEFHESHPYKMIVKNNAPYEVRIEKNTPFWRE